jgi:HSP20 family protein
MSPTPQIRSDAHGEYFFFPPEQLAAPSHYLAPADEGELAVDIFETQTELIVQSTIAGVQLADLELSLHNDLLTIRGTRSHQAPPGARLLFNECYWGNFSRSIILPAEVRGDEASAIMRAGVLTVTLPKRHRSTIPVKEIE